MKNNHCIKADQIEKFLEAEVDADAAARIESHLSQCDACARKIESFKKFTVAWDGWTAARHGDAWRCAHEETRAVSRDAAVDILGDAGREAFGALTALEKKRIEKWDRDYDPPTRERDHAGGRDGEGFMLLAASMDRETSAWFGEALGVAVDEKTKKGAIIGVSARVGKEIREEGSVRIVGSQVEGRSRNGIGYQTTPPLQLLGERLRERFKAPVLAPLALHKRDVYIEIENTDYLSRSGSLMLSVIAAVIKAVTGKTGFEDVVYSADVDLDGGVQGVGRIPNKAEFVFAEGSLRFATASDGLHEIPAHLRETHAEDIVSFREVSDLMKYLRVDISAGRADAAAISSPPSRKKYVGPVRTPLLVLALIASGFMAFLVFVTGSFYATADVLTLISLSPGAGELPHHGRIMEVALWIILIAWMSGLGLFFFITILSRRGKTTGFPKLERMGNYPLEQTIALLVLIYFALNVHMFAGKTLDDFQRYEQVEHLIQSDFFKDAARDIPNHRYEMFLKLATGREKGELERALTIGLEIRPSDPMFKKAFVEMTGILMDRVNNVVHAKRLMGSYIEFTEFIRDNPNATRWTADTIDAAEDLMNHYTLKETFYGEKRFGALIGEIVLRYGL